jgi:hypothetical protein
MSRVLLLNPPVELRYGVLAIVCASILGAASAAAAFTKDVPARILYIGDSLAANTAAEVVASTQEATGRAVTSYSAFPGMAICDFLESPNAEMGRPERLRAQVRATQPHLVILQFWGNAFTKCMIEQPSNTIEYYRSYFDDAERAVRAIEETALAINVPRPRILWVLQGPEPGVPGRTPLLNNIYRWVAAVHGDRTTDAGLTLSAAVDPTVTDTGARDRWVQTLPCNEDERGTPYCTHPNIAGGVAQLHRDDDPIHFCLGNHDFFFDCDAPSPAIRRYGRRIARDANAWLGIN